MEIWMPVLCEYMSSLHLMIPFSIAKVIISTNLSNTLPTYYLSSHGIYLQLRLLISVRSGIWDKNNFNWMALMQAGNWDNNMEHRYVVHADQSTVVEDTQLLNLGEHKLPISRWNEKSVIRNRHIAAWSGQNVSPEQYVPNLTFQILSLITGPWDIKKRRINDDVFLGKIMKHKRNYVLNCQI